MAFTKKYLYAVVLAVLTVSVYSTSLQNGFVEWDDGDYVYQNVNIRSLDAAFLQWAFLDFHTVNWHPLTWISHAVDYAIWGLKPSGHHFTSIILHGINSVLVLYLSVLLYRKALENRSSGDPFFEKKALAVGFIAGLLFALHPLRVESVAWVAERKDVLCGFFFLLSLLAYLKYKARENTGDRFFSELANKWYLLSLFFFVLALLSKPMAVTLPAVLLILDWYPLGISIRPRLLLRSAVEKAPFFVFSFILMLLTLSAQSHVIRPLAATPLLGRILVGTKAFVVYLYKMAWPLDLSPIYPYPEGVSALSPGYGIPFLVFVGITIFAVIISKKRKEVLAVWLYYVITLLPVLGIIQVASIAMADRYTYLPGIGPVLLLSGVIVVSAEKARSIIQREKIFLVTACFAAIVVLGLLSYTTINQIRVWKNSLSFWSRVIEVEPGYSKAYDERGATYGNIGYYQLALKDFDRAIELNPQFWKAFYNRGLAHYFLGRHQDALSDFTQALQMQRPFPDIYQYRGDAEVKLGLFEEALKDYTRAISYDVNGTPRYYYQRASLNDLLGRHNAAARDRQEALRVGQKTGTGK